MTDIDPEIRVKTLIALTEELSAIIARENDLLATRRPADLSSLQPDKARLAAAYAQSIRHIAANRSSLAQADDGLIEKLRELTRTFEEHATHQRALLDGARAAGESVLRAIAAEAGQTCDGSYGAGVVETAPIAVDSKA